MPDPKVVEDVVSDPSPDPNAVENPVEENAVQDPAPEEETSQPLETSDPEDVKEAIGAFPHFQTNLSDGTTQVGGIHAGGISLVMPFEAR